MLGRFFPISIFSLLITGCAATPLPPITFDNPTNANAAEAPLPPPSTTLNEDRPPDTQPAADSMDGMHMQGTDGGMKGMDLKGMDMKKGEEAMPGMQHGPTSRRSQ